MLSPKEQELYNKKLGEVIRAVRIKAGVTQEDLSSRLGFKTRVSVANIENGKQNIYIHTLAEISETLKVPVASLIPSLDLVKKEVDPKLAKDIHKEIVNNKDYEEKMKDFIRYTKSKNT